MRAIASARYAGSWAPDAANFPLKIKQGTPSMPASLAESASRSTSATSRSLSNVARISSGRGYISRCLHEHSVVGQIGAFGEIKIHQLLFHFCAAGVSAQWINRRIKRIGLLADFVDRVGEASADAAADTRCVILLYARDPNLVVRYCSREMPSRGIQSLRK